MEGNMSDLNARPTGADATNHDFFQEDLQLPTTSIEEFSGDGTAKSQDDSKYQCLEVLDTAECEEWVGKLMFPVIDGKDGTKVEIRDVLEFATCTELKYKKKPPYYFPIDKYPIDGGYNGEGYKKLCKDLQIAAAETGGFHISRNGSSRLKSDLKGCKRFCCKRRQMYRGDHKTRTSQHFKMITSQEYRKSMKENHVGINKLARRSTTTLPVNSDHKCKFFFNLHFDEHGFHILNGRGRNTHTNHLKLPNTKNNIPTRLQRKEQSNIPVDFNSLQKILQNNFTCKFCGGCLMIENEKIEGSAAHNIIVSCRRTKTCGKKYQTMYRCTSMQDGDGAEEGNHNKFNDHVNDSKIVK